MTTNQKLCWTIRNAGGVLLAALRPECGRAEANRTADRIERENDGTECVVAVETVTEAEWSQHQVALRGARDPEAGAAERGARFNTERDLCFA